MLTCRKSMSVMKARHPAHTAEMTTYANVEASTKASARAERHGGPPSAEASDRELLFTGAAESIDLTDSSSSAHDSRLTPHRCGARVSLGKTHPDAASDDGRSVSLRLGGPHAHERSA